MVNTTGRMRIRLLATLLLLPVCAFAIADPQRFNIPAQPMASALKVFAEQARMQLLYRADAVSAGTSNPVIGELERRTALEMLVRGSGLEVVFSSDDAATIRPAQSRLRRSANDPQVADPPSLRAQDESGDPSTNDTSVSSSQGASKSEGAPEWDTAEEILEVVVTGTHIPGADTGSKVVVLTRQEIERSGYTTLQDVLKTVPQVGPGDSETNTLGSSNIGNFGRGYSVDLRGLGPSTTLVLINGSRQAFSGTRGAFVDLNGIPLAAVERVEILLDGSAAIYGSDAIGGVVNIITKRDYQGFETNVRVGTMRGDSNEVVASQLAGFTWSRGGAMLGYEFRKRDSLRATDRSFSADSDQTRNGGSNYSSTQSNPGNVVDPSTGLPAFAIPAGQDGSGLTGADLIPGAINYTNVNVDLDLLAEQEWHSVFLSATQGFGEQVEAFADARYSHRPYTASSGRVQGAQLFVSPVNPFFVDPPAPVGGIDLAVVDYSFYRDLEQSQAGEANTYSAVTGVTIRASGTWELTPSVSYSRETLDFVESGVNTLLLEEALGNLPGIDDPATPYNPLVDGFFNPFGDGSHTNRAVLEALRGEATESATSEAREANVQATGAVARIGSRTIRAAIGLGYREDDIASGTGGFTGLPPARVDLSRNVESAYAQLSVPLIAGPRSLTTSIAARYERYDDFGDTVNPQVGLAWKPLEELKLRGTWGTSFRAPSLTQLDSLVFNPTFATIQSMRDPLSTSPTGRSRVLRLSGVNPDLHEERSEQWTAGFDLILGSESPFSLSMTYHAINYRDRIAIGGTPGALNNVLFEEDVWAPIITRNPTPEQIAEACSGPNAFCSGAPPVAIVDFRLRNLALVHERGIDAEVSKAIQTPSGSWDFSLRSAYTLSNERAASRRSASVDVVDTAGNVISLRVRGAAFWRSRSYELGIFANYLPSYNDTRSVLTAERRIGSWTTFDLSAAYRFRAAEGFLAGAQARLSVTNVADRDPPYVDMIYGYDGANANPYGRVLGIEVSKSW